MPTNKNICRLIGSIGIVIGLLAINLMTRAQVVNDTTETRSDTTRTATDTVQAGVDTTQIQGPARPDSLTADTLAQPRPQVKITPWSFVKPPTFNIEVSDSTLRWQMWPNWMAFTNRKSGTITYRRGRVGYNEAMLIHSHESRHQQLLWEGHLLNDPVTGGVRWVELPHHKLNYIYNDPSGGRYRTNFNINQYYVNQPESRFRYDEGKFDYRSLEFMVTRNFSRKTNAEISYWLRRDGGAYPRDVSTGSQIYGSIYHHLDSDRMLKAAFLHNSFKLQQSFGYRIANMNTYNFDRYNTAPTENSASSNWAANYLNIGYYRRNAFQGPDRYRLKLFLNSGKRNLAYSTDTTRYNVKSVRTKVQAWEKKTWGNLYGEVGGGQYWEQASQHQSLGRSRWTKLDAAGTAEWIPASRLRFSLEPMGSWRSDGYKSWELGVESSWHVGGLMQLKADASMGSYMPSIQQLYWQSADYHGNAQLRNEEIKSLGAELEFHPRSFSFGLRGRIKQVEEGIFMNTIRDSTFQNSPHYYSTMAEAFFGFDGTHIQLQGSATWHQFQSSSSTPIINNLIGAPARVWFKSSAYLKGYVLDRAAYVKAGVFGMYSPNFYRSSQLFVPLGIWQSANTSQLLPPFYRVDAELSARVRKIMVHLRWENVTNQLGQLGYFETARYPMPGRRFMLGIRVIFNN